MRREGKGREGKDERINLLLVNHLICDARCICHVGEERKLLLFFSFLFLVGLILCSVIFPNLLRC